MAPMVVALPRVMIAHRLYRRRLRGGDRTRLRRGGNQLDCSLNRRRRAPSTNSPAARESERGHCGDRRKFLPLHANPL